MAHEGPFLLRSSENVVDKDIFHFSDNCFAFFLVHLDTVQGEFGSEVVQLKSVRSTPFLVKHCRATSQVIYLMSKEISCFGEMFSSNAEARESSAPLTLSSEVAPSQCRLWGRRAYLQVLAVFVSQSGIKTIKNNGRSSCRDMMATSLLVHILWPPTPRILGRDGEISTRHGIVEDGVAISIQMLLKFSYVNYGRGQISEVSDNCR